MAARTANLPPTIETPTVRSVTTDAAVAAGDGIDWTAVLTNAGAAAAVLAFLILVVKEIHAWRTREERQERQNRADEMPIHIAKVTDMVTAAVVDLRGRTPRLRVAWALDRDEDVHHHQLDPAVRINVDAIVAAERAAALATLPPPRRAAPTAGGAEELPPGMAEFMKKLAAQHRSFTEMGRRAGFSRPAVTQANLDEFAVSVDEYASRLREFLEDASLHAEADRHVVPLRVALSNDGGAPADDVTVRLMFPDPFRRADQEDTPIPPKRPRFRPPMSPMEEQFWRFQNRRIPQLSMPPRLSPRVAPSQTGPHYEDGSLRVRFWEKSVQHLEPPDLLPFLVFAPEAGTFDIPWTISAGNVPTRESGSLRLVIEPEDATRDLTTLAAVMELLELVDEVAAL